MYLDARLAMLVGVEGCSAPSFVLKVSATYTNNLPPALILSVDIRLAMQSLTLIISRTQHFLML
jgi:hypothetical protein